VTIYNDCQQLRLFLITGIFNDLDAINYVEQMIIQVKLNLDQRFLPLKLILFDKLSIKTVMKLKEMIEENTFVRSNLEV
jgi:hypothetical protein